jgi:putative transposase
LREQEAGSKTANVCRKHGISSATFYSWKAKYGGLEVSDAKRLKTLEDENAKLKRRLAEAMLDNATLHRKMVTPAARREAVAHLRIAYDISGGRVRRLEPIAPLCAIGALPPDNAAGARLRELASVRRAVWLSTAHILLQRERVVINRKKLRRLSPEERLQVIWRSPPV